MIQNVFLKKRGVKAKNPKSKPHYYGRYKIDGDKKITEVSLRTTDKRVAEQKLALIVKEAQQERAGIIAPKGMRQAATVTVAEHLANHVADLKVKGRDKKHYGLVQSRITRLIAECGWKHLRDITPQSFLSWRSKEEKLSANHSMSI
ncbi:MAG: hypothetical protein JKX85_14190 [Phycisphaeraceae bacterium]|nr:hypothetical protein [Phycisphaeraceae bacterium]